MTTREVLLSLFSQHNELVNVWTHLLSAVWFAYLAFRDFNGDGTRPIALYTIFATFLFLCSTSFHLFQAFGVAASRVLVKLDYAGILIQVRLVLAIDIF